MAYKVVYKKRFINKLIGLLQYLEKEWNEKAAVDFLIKMDQRIETIRSQPFIGKVSALKPNVRTTLITRHNRLYYKFSNNQIIILNLYDTRKNPKKNPYGF